MDYIQRRYIYSQLHGRRTVEGGNIPLPEPLFTLNTLLRINLSGMFACAEKLVKCREVLLVEPFEVAVGFDPEIPACCNYPYLIGQHIAAVSQMPDNLFNTQAEPFFSRFIAFYLLLSQEMPAFKQKAEAFGICCQIFTFQRVKVMAHKHSFDVLAKVAVGTDALGKDPFVFPAGITAGQE